MVSDAPSNFSVVKDSDIKGKLIFYLISCTKICTKGTSLEECIRKTNDKHKLAGVGHANGLLDQKNKLLKEWRKENRSLIFGGTVWKTDIMGYEVSPQVQYLNGEWADNRYAMLDKSITESDHLVGVFQVDV